MTLHQVLILIAGPDNSGNKYNPRQNITFLSTGEAGGGGTMGTLLSERKALWSAPWTTDPPAPVEQRAGGGGDLGQTDRTSVRLSPGSDSSR